MGEGGRYKAADTCAGRGDGACPETNSEGSSIVSFVAAPPSF